MLFPERSTPYLPCQKEFELPVSIKDLDTSKMIKREESNGAIIFFDPLNKKVYFEKEDPDIFPLDAPIQVDLELTQKCNLRCKHCFIDSQNSSFSKKTFETVKKLGDSKVIAFELIGGEPFLVKEIFSIIRYLKERNKIVTIATNGTLITPKLAKKISKNPPLKIFVSLDGPRKINDFIRGKGSFDKTIEGIRNLNNEGIIPIISFCVNKFNIGSISSLLEEITDLKIKGIFFIFGEPAINGGRFNKCFFNHLERESVAKKILDLNLPIKYTMHFAPKKINALYYGCFFKLTMCEVTPLGDILSCPIIRKKEGNILKEDFGRIWERMQDNLKKNMPEKCCRCKWNARCFPCEFDRNEIALAE